MSGGSKAVDGNRDRDFSRGSCTHTLREKETFWIVDLGKLYSNKAKNDLRDHTYFVLIHVLT